MGRKWANIVAKKTAKDGANSKVYAKFGVEIYVAAKKGEPDPELNTALKFVIDRAKQAQVPKHVIDKAIDKAKGNTDETFTEDTDIKRKPHWILPLIPIAALFIMVNVFSLAISLDPLKSPMRFLL